MEKCPICSEDMEYSRIGSRDAYAVNCHRCGTYHITRTALVNIRSGYFTDREIANIAGWLSDNSIFEITTQHENFLHQINTPSFHERADKLLIALENETEYAGAFLAPNPLWQRKSWCINENELNELLAFLEETRRIESDGSFDGNVKIRPEGWSHLENLKKINSDAQQGFVAMWFSDEMNPLYENVIAPAIMTAGYQPHRVDQREHNDKIDDEIIAQIKKSRFVFADFTGHRGGVYFEAGFAKGLGLEVFWSCREDDIDNLHFDIRQYNCITWKSDQPEEFKSKITNRIEAVLGHGKS
jgi:hypothetical protein